jgi:hypothetical protein
MSKLAYILSGSKPAFRKMKVNETMATSGVPVLAGTANEAAGVILGAAATGVDQYGMTLDTATFTAAQTATNSEIEEFVTVCVSPDAVWQSRMSGSATSGTALTAYYNTTASATGVLIIPVVAADLSGATVDTSQWDDCPIFCYSGANAGQYREPADAPNIDFPQQAWSKPIAAGDRFFGVPAGHELVHSVTFTTLLDEIDAEFDTTANVASYYRPVDLVLNDEANNGLLNSYLNVIACDHMYSGSSLA